MQTPEQITAGLSEDARKFIRATSGKHFKSWRTICRDAKISIYALFLPIGLLEHSFKPRSAFRLTPLGLAVRKIITQEAGGHD